MVMEDCTVQQNYFLARLQLMVVEHSVVNRTNNNDHLEFSIYSNRVFVLVTQRISRPVGWTDFRQ